MAIVGPSAIHKMVLIIDSGHHAHPLSLGRSTTIPQAEELEAQRAKERLEAAQEAFVSFDTNDDGTVDLKELIAGLEGQLRQDFVKRMTKTIGRRPSDAEIEEKISEMPGGVLLPEDVSIPPRLVTVVGRKQGNHTARRWRV